MGFRFSGRRDGLLLAGFALALLTIFDQTFGQLLQLASDVEATYHVRLLPALVVLTVLLILHLHTRRQEMKVRAREAAAEARVAGERARDLELLAALGRALAGVLTEDALRAALWRHLPPLAGKDDLWVLLGDGPRVTLLLDTTGNPAVAVAAEEISRHLLDASSDEHSIPDGHGPYRCFVISSGGRPLGVLGVLDTDDALDERAGRLIEAACALLGIAVRNVELFAETREHALTDALTQCFNRAHILQVIEGELRRSRRTRSPLSVVMLDIDQFKSINDRAGHLGGDAVLAAIGTRLSEVLRHSDVRGRFGGDEFLIVLPDTPAAGAAYVAEALRREIEELRIPVEGEVARVTASVGVATAGAGEIEANAVVGRADHALYRAKDSGRNCVIAADMPEQAEDSPTTRMRRAS